VYAAPVDNEVALHHRISDACQTIRSCPGIFARTRRSVMRRVEVCTEYHGGRFEHFIINTISVINYRLNVSRHMLIRAFFSCFGMWNSCPTFVLTFQLHCIFIREEFRAKINSRYFIVLGQGNEWSDNLNSG
jgi:hypothetical protein